MCTTSAEVCEHNVQAEAEFLFCGAEQNRVEGAETVPEAESCRIGCLRPSLVSTLDRPVNSLAFSSNGEGLPTFRAT